MSAFSLFTSPHEEKTGICHGGNLMLGMIAGLVLILDQITKLMILRMIPLYGEVVVIPGFFNIVHVLNPGGAFGFMANFSSSVRYIFFIGVSLIALGLVYYFYRTTPKAYRFLSTAFALIFGGAIGNIVDRIRFGKVVDFLDCYVGTWHWPAFNIADSAITIGIGIFIFHLLFGKMPKDMFGGR